MGRKFKTWCFSFYRIKKKSVDDLSISVRVAIFVKEYLYFTKILSKSILIRTDSDSIWTFDSNYCIKFSNSSITVAGCYRPLSAPSCVLTTLGSILSSYTNSEFISLGELNEICWILLIMFCSNLILLGMIIMIIPWESWD